MIRILLSILLAGLVLFGVGCKKKDDPVKINPDEQTKQFEKKAQEEINEENLESELDKIEAELEADLTTE